MTRPHASRPVLDCTGPHKMGPFPRARGNYLSGADLLPHLGRRGKPERRNCAQGLALTGPDRKGRRPKVGPAGWRGAVAVTSRCPDPLGVWGKYGRNPRKPVRRAAEQRQAQPPQALRVPCHDYKMGVRGGGGLCIVHIRGSAHQHQRRPGRPACPRPSPSPSFPRGRDGVT